MPPKEIIVDGKVYVEKGIGKWRPVYGDSFFTSGINFSVYENKYEVGDGIDSWTIWRTREQAEEFAKRCKQVAEDLHNELGE